MSNDEKEIDEKYLELKNELKLVLMKLAVGVYESKRKEILEDVFMCFSNYYGIEIDAYTDPEELIEDSIEL